MGGPELGGGAGGGGSRGWRAARARAQPVGRGQEVVKVARCGFPIPPVDIHACMTQCVMLKLLICWAVSDNTFLCQPHYVNVGTLTSVPGGGKWDEVEWGAGASGHARARCTATPSAGLTCRSRTG